MYKEPPSNPYAAYLDGAIQRHHRKISHFQVSAGIYRRLWRYLRLNPNGTMYTYSVGTDCYPIFAAVYTVPEPPAIRVVTTNGSILETLYPGRTCPACTQDLQADQTVRIRRRCCLAARLLGT